MSNQRTEINKHHVAHNNDPRITLMKLNDATMSGINFKSLLMLMSRLRNNS